MFRRTISSVGSRWRPRPLAGAALALLLAGAGPDTAEAQRPGSAAAPLVLAEDRRIGEPDGRTPDVFGFIQGVTTDAAGWTYVLDSRMTTVRVFDSRGRYVASVGRRGRGPGEFVNPVSLAVDAAGTLYVLDIGASRVSRFTVRREGSVPTGDFRVPFPAQSMCLLDDSLYLLGYDSGRIVHAFSVSGQRLTSFGEPFHEHPMLRRMLTVGPIACVSNSRTILVNSNLLPAVRAYATDGRLRWTSNLSGPFEAVTIDTSRPGAVTYGAPRQQGIDMITSIVPLPGARVLVQFGRQTPDARHPQDIERVQTRVLSLATGEALSASGDVPRVDAYDGREFFSIVHDPFPQVVVTREREHGRR
jgi:hypothetical protein